MDELLEKLKTVDKKILIGVGAGAAVVIILIIVLIAGGGSKPAGSDTASGSQKNTQQETQSGKETEESEKTETESMMTELGTEVFGTEIGTEFGTEVIGTEISTESATEITTEVMTPDTQAPESQAPDSQVPESQLPTTESPSGGEILGAGSASQPYMECPNLSNMTLTTVAIPAGKALYYNIQRVGGMWLTIEASNVYIITSNGTRYDAQNGKISIKVEDAMADEYVSFQIGNSGSSPASFTLKFSNIKGTYQNPEKLSSVGTYSVSLAAGNEQGYYYKYSAQQSGVLRFYIISATADANISVTNNRNSANRTLAADALTDENGNTYVELEVNQGDEILISVGATPDRRYKYPAADVTWEMKF